MAIVSIFSGLCSMIILLKLTKKVHWAFVLAILITGIVSQNLSFIGNSFSKALIQQDLYKTILVVSGIFLLSDTMNKVGSSEKFANIIKDLFNPKQAIAIISMVFGLLPTPGGTMLTASMAKDIAEESKIDKLDACAMNYWFRHSMEFFWILYPAMILQSSLSGISLTKLLIIQLPIGFFAIIGGLSHFKTGKIKIKINKKLIKELFKSISPIIIIMIGIIISIPGWLIVPIVSVVYALFHKNSKDLFNIRWETILLLLVVFWYKEFITISNLSTDFVVSLTNLGLNPFFIIIISSIVLTLITGVTQTGVSIMIPIVLSFTSEEVIHLVQAVVSIYFFSVVGVIFSPAHLCLLLTTEYFEVNMFSVIKRLIIPLFLSLIGYIFIMFTIMT